MKTITAKSFFKTVTAKNSPKYGQKREDLEWSFDGFEAQDVLSCDNEEIAEKLATLVNAQLESYGRKRILAESEDWNFDPSAEITLDTVYTDLTAETTRKRKVTKETLAKCGEFYAAWSHLIGKNAQAASAGSQVIAQKLVPIAANAQALEVMRDNILALIEKCAEESDNNISLAEQLEDNSDCLEWLVNECDSLIEDSKKNLADAL